VASDSPTYAFPNDRALQAERLQLLASLLDEGTFSVMSELGVKPGWRCLEVGAGSGSVARWLCERVAPGGSVLATDLDTTVLAEIRHPCLDVRVHDLLHDGLPEQGFDLVHARLLLAWLADPAEGLRRMVSALRPAGIVVVEEMDFESIAPGPGLPPGLDEGCFQRVIQAHHAVLADHHAFDPFCGRRLPRALSAAGLVEIGSRGRASVWEGGQAGGRVWALTLVQLREQLVATKHVTPIEVDEVIRSFDRPGLSFLSPVTVAAWARRSR
jgi:SAM-dependent methyltransferase